MDNYKKEVIGDCTLWLADCRDVMAEMEDKSVDAVVTDPPYGVSLGYHAGSSDRRDGVLKKSGYESYDDSKENFIEIISPRISQALKKASRGLVFCAGNRIWDLPPADNVGGVYIPSGMGRNNWGFATIQHCLLYGAAPNLNLGAKATALRSCDTAEKNGHPCPKPVRWMTWAVGLASAKTDIVFDPFMGSGTTGVACVELGRKFIGVEIEPKYFDIACKRIDMAARQGKLF